MTLTATGLSVVHSGRTLLHPVTLSIAAGERIGLVGASGSGKSTLGNALVDELSSQGVSVAHVPQSPDEALDPLRSMAFQWHEAERALNQQPDPTRQQQLFSALQIEGGDLLKRPWGWSRGMQQRFVISMALIGTPALLVLDEPTSALDPVVAANTMDLLDAVLGQSDNQTAMLLITHDLWLAARRVSRLLVMEGGQIAEDAPTADILERPRTGAAQVLASHRSWLSLPCS
ncbi:ABC transporter [Chromatiales bacterium (ex Bugula neritina AB1)]|nr:ABC transporter [Chromatiales bacterium (ex Bugula neritina AB1)]